MTKLLLIALAATLPALSQPRAMLPYAGRWDLTITTPTGTYPSWMEVSQKDDVAVVVVVGSEGGLHGSDNVRLQPREINTAPGLNESAVTMGERTVLTSLYFTTLEKFGGKQVPVAWQIDSVAGRITGTQKRGDGVVGDIAGEHAPPLKRKAVTKWNAPEALLSADALRGWTPFHAPDNHWKLQSGVLRNDGPGADLRTDKTYEDFQLHVEFNCARGCNSGIFLRGRYELQIEYGAQPAELPTSVMGSIFGFLAPATAVAARPGEWESFDVTLVGRNVTVLRNGTAIIDNKPIPGITGGAIDSREAQPGPIWLQGDATGGIQFRNITIATPAR